MKGKQIAILLALLVIVGGIGLFLQKRNQSAWRESAAPPGGKLLDFPINDVTQVVIRDSKEEVRLEKQNGVWTVVEKDYPAAFERVSGLIRQLWELHPLQQIKAGPSQFGRLGLSEPGHGDNAGTVVELKDQKNKTLAKIIAGKRVMPSGLGPENFRRLASIPMGRYVLAPGVGGDTVCLVNQPLEVDAKPQSWLKRDFIKIENPTSIELAGHTPARHWRLSRSDTQADWKLAGANQNEKLNNVAAHSFANLLAALRFNDVLPADAKPEQHGLDKPDVLTVQTSDRFTYTLNIGKLAGDNYPVSISVAADPVKERVPAPDEKPDAKAKLDEEFQKHLKQLEEKAAAEKEYGKRIYLVPKYSLEPFLKDRADLLAKATPTPAPSTTPHKRR